MKQILGKLTFSNVIACIALFVALGGASYAAFKLPKNSVGAKQIKKEAVTAAKVRDGSLQAADFAAGQVPAGPKGDTGPPGPAGAALGFAHVSHGALDAQNSKGVVGMVNGVNYSGTESADFLYCFDLSFTPTNISVTPEVGTNSGGNHPAVGASGVVPARAPAISAAGCPPGYRDAEVFATDSEEHVPIGVYVLFN